MNGHTAPRRVHRSLLAPVEKKFLVYLASRMPAWVTPDLLTASGVLGGVIVFAGYLMSNRDPGWLWAANLGLVVHWFGDSLDGTLARVRARERPRYGFFLDQTIDVIGNILIMAGLGLSPYARLDTALLALAGYHALSIYSLVWNAVANEHHVSIAGFGPTEIRIILFAINAGVYFGGAPRGFLGFAQLTWCDGVMLAGFAAMAVLFIASFVADARALHNDPSDKS